MADTLWFSNDHHDMSVEWGNDAGFQFEFNWNAAPSFA